MTPLCVKSRSQTESQSNVRYLKFKHNCLSFIKKSFIFLSNVSNYRLSLYKISSKFVQPLWQTTTNIQTLLIPQLYNYKSIEQYSQTSNTFSNQNAKNKTNYKLHRQRFMVAVGIQCTRIPPPILKKKHNLSSLYGMSCQWAQIRRTGLLCKIGDGL